LEVFDLNGVCRPRHKEHSVLATMSGIADYDWNMAETHFRKALAAEPVSAMVRFRYVWYFLLPWGRFQDLSPWWAEGGWYLAAAYHQAADRHLSQEWARRLASSHGQTVAAAIYYAAAGEIDAVFEALDGAYQRREPRLPLIPNRSSSPTATIHFSTRFFSESTWRSTRRLCPVTPSHRNLSLR
jgi:hypothetical protein